MSQPVLPHTGPSLKELRMNTGVFSIMIKSMSARLITNMLEGVRRLLVLAWGETRRTDEGRGGVKESGQEGIRGGRGRESVN